MSFNQRFLSLATGLFFAFNSITFAQKAPQPPVSESLTLWQLVVSAEWILVPIIVLSFIIISLILFNFFYLRQRNIASPEFLAMAERLIEKRSFESLIDFCDKANEAASNILKRVVIFAKENPSVDIESLQRIAESEGNRQAVRMNIPTQLLMDMGVMAPMVGLLGTVIGILRSFGTLASDTTPMRTAMLAGGVSQALIATAMGLTLGLIAMFFYAYFRARVQALLTHYESSTTELLARMYDKLAGE